MKCFASSSWTQKSDSFHIFHMDNNGKRKLDNSATSFRQSPRNYAAKDEIYFSRISFDVEKLKKIFCLIPKISCTIKDKKKPHHIINLRFSEVVKDHAKYIYGIFFSISPNICILAKRKKTL